MPNPLKVTIYRRSDLVGEERFDRDIIKIGRLASAHLKLDDPKVARIHAVIEVASDGAGFSIIDMGSTDGTFVNGERVSKEKLKDGDEIQIGDSRLVVTFEGLSGVMPASAGQAAVAAAAAALSAPPAAAAPTNGGVVVPVQPAPMPPPPPPVSEPAMPYQAAQAVSVPPPAVENGHGVAHAVSAPPQPVYAQAPVYTPSHGVPSQGPIPIPSIVPPSSTMVTSNPWGNSKYVSAAAWGSVPNNLASEGVPENERALEIKTVWGDSVLDTVTATTRPVVTLGDEGKVSGFGPFQKFIPCDIEVPARGLPSRTFPIAVSRSQNGTSYAINIHDSFTGRLEKADGTAYELADALKKGGRAERGDLQGTTRYNLEAEETLYLHHGQVHMQLRYVRQAKLAPTALFERLNYTWVNIFILAFFFHVLAVASFISTPRITEDLNETIFKNPNRFAQFKLTPEKKEKQKNDFLAKLKEGAAGAKARGVEGKAGKKDYKGKQGRMAVKAIDPNDKEVAKSTLARLFGGAGAGGGRSYLFGSGGLGGELKGALGGVTGAEIGDATGLGGLGTRGSGPGGGGLSMSSVGLGALGTAGRGGGGDGSYGQGVGSLGKKSDRDINISAGSPIVMGSLDKELIRRVIKQHLAQIRYCYEKELVRSPGLFGKVGAVWTITAEGTVRDAKIENTSMNNAEVERCIASKITTWVFPKPKGGGIVIVRYPFVFKTTG